MHLLILDSNSSRMMKKSAQVDLHGTKNKLNSLQQEDMPAGLASFKSAMEVKNKFCYLTWIIFRMPFPFFFKKKLREQKQRRGALSHRLLTLCRRGPSSASFKRLYSIS